MGEAGEETEVMLGRVRHLEARIRELEAECKMHCQAAQDLVVECDRWRKRAEKAEAENARLREAGEPIAIALAHAAHVTDMDSNGHVTQMLVRWDEARRGAHG